jgi:hypothetical protein
MGDASFTTVREPTAVLDTAAIQVGGDGFATTSRSETSVAVIANVKVDHLEAECSPNS